MEITAHPSLQCLAGGLLKEKVCNSSRRGGSRFCKSIAPCVRDVSSDQRLMGTTWEKGSSHFVLRLDQIPGELMKLNFCQKALNHYNPSGLDYSFGLLVMLLVLSVHADWNLLLLTATSIKIGMDEKLKWEWIVPGGPLFYPAEQCLLAVEEVVQSWHDCDIQSGHQ